MIKNYTLGETLLSCSEMSYDIKPGNHEYRPHDTYDLTIAERAKSIEKDKDLNYKLNNFGHRSDDFNTLSFDKVNILFAGCSTTFGEGLKQKHRWTDRLYERLSHIHKNIGPLNVLSYPGFGVNVIIPNIFKYIEKFGKPDIIFFLAPDYFRDIDFDNSGKTLPNIKIDYETDEIEDGSNAETMFILYVDYIRVLEIFCKLNNIKLFFSTWDSRSHYLLQLSQLNTYQPVVNDSQIELKKTKYLRYYDSLDVNDRAYAYDARDGDHPGILTHEYFSNCFLEMYTKSGFIDKQ